jgi:hypothetical protein
VLNMTATGPRSRADDILCNALLLVLILLYQRPLAQPVVADPLGKLYNKDAIIEYLLDRTSFGDGDQICGYVKGVKVSGPWLLLCQA